MRLFTGWFLFHAVARGTDHTVHGSLVGNRLRTAKAAIDAKSRRPVTQASAQDMKEETANQGRTLLTCFSM
jgi:hypothetical protein